MSIILGIDPGSRITGYGVISHVVNKSNYLGSGVIRTQGPSTIERLNQIFIGIQQIIAHYQPNEVAIEEVFLHQNPNVALKLGQARGAALVAASLHTQQLGEYSPREIKLAVVGFGAAKKDQVQHMIKVLLNLSSAPPVDAADALAVALCHAHSRHGYAKITSGKNSQEKIK